MFIYYLEVTQIFIGYLYSVNVHNNTDGVIMSHTYKLIELTGSSPISSDDAIKNAISAANKSIKHMRWFQVVETRGHLEEGLIAHWQVTVKVGFTLDQS